jgi:group I intron endonuclease
MRQKTSGVYAIIHTSGKRYIGSAIDIDKRFKEHRGALGRGKHHSVLLQRAWDKYGEAEFTFVTILECPPDLCLDYEQRCFNGFKPEYNICKTAGSRLGSKYTEEAKARLKELRKAAPRSEKQLQHLANLADASRGKAGRAIGQDERDRISASLTGRKQSQELIERRIAPLRGQKRSDEVRARMSSAKLGRKRDPITKAWL